MLIVFQVSIQATQHKDDTLSLGVSPSCAIYGASPLFFSLDVLHPSTLIAKNTPSIDSSYPTQGRYPLLGVSPSCAIQGASPSVEEASQ